MKRNVIIWIVAIFLSLLCNSKLLSQNDLDDSSLIEYFNAEQYFVNKKPTKRHNMISTNFLSYFVGDFHFSYEFKLNSFLAAEIGVGLISNRNGFGIVNEFINRIPRHNRPIKKIGFSLGLKYYLEEFPKGFYFDMKFRNRRYYGGDVFDFYVGTGIQKHFKSNLILSFGIAHGFRLVNYGEDSITDPAFFRIYPINFSLGYLF